MSPPIPEAETAPSWLALKAAMAADPIAPINRLLSEAIRAVLRNCRLVAVCIVAPAVARLPITIDLAPRPAPRGIPGAGVIVGLQAASPGMSQPCVSTDRQAPRSKEDVVDRQRPILIWNSPNREQSQ